MVHMQVDYYIICSLIFLFFLLSHTLVFKKVDISKICISFVSLGETKEKTKGISIYNF